MNVIMLINDTWRWDYLGCYGNDWIKTPNLDQFATEGPSLNTATQRGYQPCLHGPPFSQEGLPFPSGDGNDWSQRMCSWLRSFGIRDLIRLW